MSDYKYVWIDLINGEVGKSYTKEQMEQLPAYEKISMGKAKREKGKALIKYKCLTGNFEFDKFMNVENI